MKQFAPMLLGLALVAGQLCLSPAWGEDMPSPAVCKRGSGWTGASLAQAIGKDCAEITSADLLTVTELEVTGHMAPGDLNGLRNLKRLTFKPYWSNTFRAELFQGLAQLEAIHLDNTDNQGFAILTGAFSAQKKLKTIEIRFAPGHHAGGAGQIFDDAFIGLDAIESVAFIGDCTLHEPIARYHWSVQAHAFRGLDPAKLYADPACFRPMPKP